MDIYKEVILDHYKNPRNFGKMKNSQATVSVSNPLCGDAVDMELAIKNDAIHDIAFTGQGCAIAVASASLLTEYAKKKNIHDLRKLDSSFMLELLSVELSPNRLKCALVSLEALQKAIALYESNTQGSS